ncbi:MAG: hypothetical protein LIO96_03855 [Lachnospiraceae bacterium]|nr:hypothetical protein [Lachnospiraceae bacterium]
MNKVITVSGFDVDVKNIELTDFPEINGQINFSVASGVICERQTEKAVIRMSVLGPDGYLAAHKSPGVACVCIESGSGIIGIVDVDGNVKCEIRAESGDVLIFETDMPLHYYQAGENGMSYIVVSL